MVAAALVLIALGVGYHEAPRGDFIGDARFLIAENNHISSVDRLWDNLSHDYFWSSSGNSIPYWRPLTKGSWVLEWVALGGSPAVYHSVQLLWFALGALGLLLLAEDLFGDIKLAWAAAMLWVLSPVAIEPVHLIMARSDVVAAAAAIWALYFFRRWTSHARTRDLAGHLIALAIALASKEVAVMLALPLALLALADRTSPRAALVRFWPSLLLITIYLLLRALVVAGGHLTVDPSPGRAVLTLGSYLWGLFPLRVDSAIRSLSPAEAGHWLTWSRAILSSAVVLGVMLWVARRRQWLPLALLAWIGAMLAPVVLVADLNIPGVAGKIPMADRWAFHAAAPAALVFCWLMVQVASLRRFFPALVAAWALVSLILGAPEHRFYRSEQSYFAKESFDYASTPEAFRTEQDHCREKGRRAQVLLRKGKVAAGLRALENAAARCKETPQARMNRLAALLALGRLDDAARLAPAVEQQPPRDARSYGRLAFFLARVARHQGRIAPAERYLARSERLGYRGCDVHSERAELAIARRSAPAAARLFERAAGCFGSGLSSAKALVAAAYWHRRAGQAAEARRCRAKALALRLESRERRLLEALVQRLLGAPAR